MISNAAGFSDPQPNQMFPGRAGGLNIPGVHREAGFARLHQRLRLRRGGRAMRTSRQPAVLPSKQQCYEGPDK
jgi:hypothetical protein